MQELFPIVVSIAIGLIAFINQRLHKKLDELPDKIEARMDKTCDVLHGRIDKVKASVSQHSERISVLETKCDIHHMPVIGYGSRE